MFDIVLQANTTNWLKNFKQDNSFKTTGKRIKNYIYIYTSGSSEEIENMSAKIFFSDLAVHIHGTLKL